MCGSFLSNRYTKVEYHWAWLSTVLLADLFKFVFCPKEEITLANRMNIMNYIITKSFKFSYHAFFSTLLIENWNNKSHLLMQGEQKSSRSKKGICPIEEWRMCVWLMVYDGRQHALETPIYAIFIKVLWMWRPSSICVILSHDFVWMSFDHIFFPSDLWNLNPIFV